MALDRNNKLCADFRSLIFSQLSPAYNVGMARVSDRLYEQGKATNSSVIKRNKLPHR